MNQTQYRTMTAQPLSAVEMNKVLRNTYALLSMTLLFSAVMAGVAMAFNWPYPGPLIVLAGYFGLLFLTAKLRNSAWGLVSVFALTDGKQYVLLPVAKDYKRIGEGDVGPNTGGMGAHSPAGLSRTPTIDPTRHGGPAGGTHVRATDRPSPKGDGPRQSGGAAVQP